jgi:hypothetical protein
MPVPSGSRRYGAVLHLPSTGKLVVSTDLHGNLIDFKKLQKLYEEAAEENDGDVYMLLCGDLIHGPIYTRKNWPRRLGTYYPDQSVELIEAFITMRQKFPGRIFAILGNHEHSHLGGPQTRKFHKIPSETEFFELTAGKERMDIFRALFASFPILSVAGKGIVFTHGAPRVLTATLDEIARVDYFDVNVKKINEMFNIPILGELLWCRQAGPLVIRRFLKNIEVDSQRNGVVLYGHDPISSGYVVRSPEQICFSTSFGLKNKNKIFLEIDLSREFKTAYDLRPGIELKHLYPEEADEESPLLLKAEASS